MTVLVLMGIYYFHNLPRVVNSRNYIKELFEKDADFELCLDGVRIRQEKEEFYFLIQTIGKKIELKNLPESVKRDLKNSFAIKGKIIKDGPRILQ